MQRNSVIHVAPPHPHAGTYVSWNDYRHTWTPRPRLRIVEPPAWRPCSYCWGQRRILIPVRTPRGQLKGHLPITCPTCLGIGDVPSV